MPMLTSINTGKKRCFIGKEHTSRQLKISTSQLWLLEDSMEESFKESNSLFQHKNKQALKAHPSLSHGILESQYDI